MNASHKLKPFALISTISILWLLTACEGGGSGVAQNSADISPAPLSSSPLLPSSSSRSSPSSSDAAKVCANKSSNSLCIGVNYVSYISGGQPIVSEDVAVKNIQIANNIFKNCGIEFQISSYQAVDASRYGLATDYVPGSQYDSIRSTFNDGNTFLIVQTGYWGTTKNAWTSLPGNAPYGAIFESTVAENGNIIAHELGHYLNLDHANDSSNLMNALIYNYSTQLTDAQCKTVQSAAVNFWAKIVK